MGNDGGNILRRKDIVKTKLDDKDNINKEYLKEQSKYCFLSKNFLEEPICIDKYGLIYNKEEIIKKLLKKDMPYHLNHIKKLKDIKQLKIYKDNGIIKCPISNKTFNGINKFYSFWNCGCLFSENIISNKIIKDQICPICNKENGNKNKLIKILKKKEFIDKLYKLNKKTNDNSNLKTDNISYCYTNDYILNNFQKDNNLEKHHLKDIFNKNWKEKTEFIGNTRYGIR